MPQRVDVPQPRESEGHQPGYDYRARFPNLRHYTLAEGGCVYTADAEDGYYVVTDEGTMAEFLDEGDPAIFTHVFDTAVQRDVYCSARFARLSQRERPGAPRALTSQEMTVGLSYTGKHVSGPLPFHALLERYQGRALASPFRSTVPLLGRWHDVNAALVQLADTLDQDLSGKVLLSFEHCVPVQSGKGPPSQTDLLIDTPTQVVAIEAKYTEPGYQTVSSWLGKAASADDQNGRQLVLQGWLDLINHATHASLTMEQTKDCTYQLIHRTASACHEPGRQWRAIVYQLFHDGEQSAHAEYLRQLKLLTRLIGPQSVLHFYLLTCRVHPTPRYEELRARWRSGERDLSEAVRAGLRDNDLLKYEAYSALQV